MKYIVVYVTEDGSLYFDEFKSEKAALKFIDNTEDKCQLIYGKHVSTHT